MSHDEQQAIQRAYYVKTAAQYDQVHIARLDAHEFALAWLASVIKLFEFRTLLDIGSGTGRVLLALKHAIPDLKVVGIEPSSALREQGHAKGLSRTELIDGDVRDLNYGVGSFDIVTEFATLHHVPNPRLAVDEMLRVSKSAIFLSDCNNFGQGSRQARAVKQLIRAVGLWRAFDYVRTFGKGYMISEGDGLFYSYSVFDNYGQIKSACKSVHVLNTLGGGINPYRSAAAVAILGLKERAPVGA